MKRLGYAAVAALLGACVVTVAAAAAPAPGTYKGNIYAGAKKGAPGTVTVAGKKVTIKVAKFPIKCLGASGKFDAPSAPIKYEFKGTLKGNSVSGTYIDPLAARASTPPPSSRTQPRPSRSPGRSVASASARAPRRSRPRRPSWMCGLGGDAPPRSSSR